MDELGPKIQTFATTRVAVLHEGEVTLGKQNGNRDSKGNAIVYWLDCQDPDMVKPGKRSRRVAMSAGLNVYCLDGSGRDVMALPGTLERRVARRRSSTMDELGPKIQTYAIAGNQFRDWIVENFCSV